MLKLSARVGAAVVVRHPSPIMQAAMNFFILILLQIGRWIGGFFEGSRLKMNER
jgi:hypothetical protein